MRRLLEDGRPVVVDVDDRQGRFGPLARLLLTAIVVHERSTRTERGRILAHDGRIHSVSIAEEVISAGASGSEGREYEVELRAEVLPRRIWHAVASSHDGARLVEAALEGRPRAVHLEHTLMVDWGQPLVPRRDDVHRSCTCPDSHARETCKHVIALAYVLADAVDRDPSLLLHWRGCGTERPPIETAAMRMNVVERDDPWEAGPLPSLAPARPLPSAAVLKRLGSSGVEIDGRDLADVLEVAYAALDA